MLSISTAWDFNVPKNLVMDSELMRDRQGVPTQMPNVEEGQTLVAICDDDGFGQVFTINSLDALKQIDKEMDDHKWLGILYWRVSSKDISGFQNTK